MVKRKSSLGRSTSKTKRMKLNRDNETSSERNARVEKSRIKNKKSRTIETIPKREVRLGLMRNNAKRLRLNETVSDREIRLMQFRNRAAERREMHWSDLKFAAFHYNAQIEY